MIFVSQAVRIPSPADRLWRMISTSELRDAVSGSFIDNVQVEGEGVGTVLTVTLKSGAVIKERIDKIDHVEREFGFSIVDSGPASYAVYRQVIRVQPCGPDESILSARCEFLVEDGKEETVRDAWFVNNTAKFDFIRDYLAANRD